MDFKVIDLVKKIVVIGDLGHAVSKCSFHVVL